MSPDEVHKFCDEIGREFDVNEFDFTPIRQKSDITQDRAALILGQNRNRPPSATGATKKLPPVVANKKAVVPKTMVSQPSVADKPLSAPERLKRFETAKMAPQTKPAAVLPRKKSSVSASVLAPPKILSKKIRTPPPRISIKRSATKREYEGRPNLPRANKPNKVPSRSIGRPLAQEAQPTEVKAKRTVGPAGNVRKSKKEVEEILDDVRKITGLEVKSDTSEDKLHEEVDKSGENQPTSAAEPVRSNQRPHRNRRPSKRFSEESESDSPQDIPHTRSTHTSPVKRESIPSCSSERTFDDTIVSTVAQVARLPMGKNESPQRKRNANGSAIKMLAEAKKRRADAAVEARRLSQSYSSSPTRKSQSNRRANSESSLDEEDNYGESSDGKDFLSDDSDGPSKSRFLVRRSGGKPTSQAGLLMFHQSNPIHFAGVKRTGPAFLRQKSAEIPIMPGTWASRQYLPTSPSKTKRSTPASSPSKERRRSGQGSRRREMTPDDPMISAPIAVPPAIMNDHNYSKGIVIGSEDLMTAATTAKDFPQQQTHNNSSAGIITTLSGFPMVSYTAGQPLQMSSGEKTNGGATLDTITLPYTSFGPNSGNSGNLPTSSSQAGPNSQLNSGVIVVAMNNQQQSASPQLLNTRGNMATISLPPPSSDDDYGGVGDISEFVSSFNAADFGHFSSQSALGRNSGKTVVAASTSRSVTAAVPTGNLTVGGAVQKPPVSRGEESDEEDDDGVKISFIDLKTGQLQTGSGRQIIHKTKFSQLQQPPPSTLSLIPRSVAIPPIVEDKLPANIFEGDDVATGGIEDEDKS